MAITPQQAKFTTEYLIDLNATQAAIRAGYSKKTAKAQGSRLLTVVDVQRAVQEQMKDRQERTQIDADYVLSTIRDTVERCRGVGAAFDPSNVLKGCDLLARHLGMFQRDHEQGKDRLVIIKDFTGDMK